MDDPQNKDHEQPEFLSDDELPRRDQPQETEKPLAEQAGEWAAKGLNWVNTTAVSANKLREQRYQEQRQQEQERLIGYRAERQKAEQHPDQIYDRRVYRSKPFIPYDLSTDLHYRLLGYQEWQVGQLIDYWGQTLPGYADKASDFWIAWRKFMKASKITNAGLSWDWLMGTGVPSQERKMIFIRRNGATVTLYIATQGNDLFISIRAFIQTPLNYLLLLVFLVISAGTAWYYKQMFWPSFYNQGVDGTFLAVTGVVFAILCILAAVNGRLRLPPSNLYLDDITSLASAVHQGIVASADKVGIDETLITPYQPQPLQAWKKRF